MSCAVVLAFMGLCAVRGATIEGTVARVIDGDTVEVVINPFPDRRVTLDVRLKGVNAPEIRGRCDYERDLAQRAKRRLAAIIGGSNVTLAEIEDDKYGGRTVARLIVRGMDAGAILVNERLAVPYDGRTRKMDWC